MRHIILVLFLIIATAAFSSCNAAIEGFLVDFENECHGPDYEVIMYVNAKENKGPVSAAMGCYRDTATDEYWVTTHLLPSKYVRKSTLVEEDYESCGMWDLCELDEAEK